MQIQFNDKDKSSTTGEKTTECHYTDADGGDRLVSKDDPNLLKEFDKNYTYTNKNNVLSSTKRNVISSKHSFGLGIMSTKNIVKETYQYGASRINKYNIMSGDTFNKGIQLGVEMFQNYRSNK